MDKVVFVVRAAIAARAHMVAMKDRTETESTSVTDWPAVCPNGVNVEVRCHFDPVPAIGCRFSIRQDFAGVKVEKRAVHPIRPGLWRPVRVRIVIRETLPAAAQSAARWLSKAAPCVHSAGLFYLPGWAGRRGLLRAPGLNVANAYISRYRNYFAGFASIHPSKTECKQQLIAAGKNLPLDVY